MKTLLFFVFLFPLNLLAQDNYVGIWVNDFSKFPSPVPAEQQIITEYYSLHRSGQQVVAAFLDAREGVWFAYEGTLLANVVALNSINAPLHNMAYKITFESENEGYVTKSYCPTYSLQFPWLFRDCVKIDFATVPIRKLF